MKHSITISIVFLATTTLARGSGLELNAAELRGESSKKPISVLENRYFTKQMRPEVGLALGSFLNEAYTNTITTGFRTALFPNEWAGLELQYVTTTVKDSADRKALNGLVYRDRDDQTKLVSPDPEVNPIHGALDLNAVVAPFYGKLNFMNQLILYSDLYVTGGLSQVDTEQGKLNAMVIGAGERFYFQKSLSFRVDYRDRIYTEKRAGSTSRKNAQSIDFGIAYFFL